MVGPRGLHGPRGDRGSPGPIGQYIIWNVLIILNITRLHNEGLENVTY